MKGYDLKKGHNCLLLGVNKLKQEFQASPKHNVIMFQQNVM